MTVGESKLWMELRNRQFQRAKFRRQVAVGPYIADFLSYQYRLIIEVDGSSHAEKKDYDDERDLYLAGQGFRILHLPDALVRSSLNIALQKIEQALRSRTLPSPSPAT